MQITSLFAILRLSEVLLYISQKRGWVSHLLFADLRHQQEQKGSMVLMLRKYRDTMLTEILLSQEDNR
jgi:hypothetical protein